MSRRASIRKAQQKYRSSREGREQHADEERERRDNSVGDHSIESKVRFATVRVDVVATYPRAVEFRLSRLEIGAAGTCSRCGQRGVVVRDEAETREQPR